MEKTMLDVQETADRLGVSPKWIRRGIDNESLPFPFYKFNKLLRFRSDEVDAYIDSVRREPKMAV